MARGLIVRSGCDGCKKEDIRDVKDSKRFSTTVHAAVSLMPNVRLTGCVDVASRLAGSALSIYFVRCLLIGLLVNAT